jgi:predicted nucleic acid-binding protein
MICVIDASALVRITMRTGDISELETVLEKADRVAAPEILIPEIANAYWKYMRFGGLEERVARERMAIALDLVTEFVGQTGIAEESLHIAAKHQHPVYDAFYLVLARRLDAPVLTVDRRLGELARAVGVTTLP